MAFLHGSSLQLYPFPSFSLVANAKNHSGRPTIVKSCLRHRENEHHGDNGGGGESDFLKRRVILCLGLSALPFIRLKADAVEGPFVDVVYRRNRSAITRSVGRRPRGYGSRAQDRQTPNSYNLGSEERSVQVSVSQETDLSSKDFQDTPEEVSKKKVHRQQKQPTTSLSVLNVFGIMGSGVLGALYTLVQKDKRSLESMIETLKRNLNEKEEAMSSLKSSLEKKVLSEQEERIKAIKKAKEEQLSLSEQLASAGSSILNMQQELQHEKRSSEELKLKLESLLTSLEQAGKDRVVLESNIREKQDLVDVLNERIHLLNSEVNDKSISINNMKLSLSEKEQGYERLLSIYGKSEKSLEEANSQIQRLTEELLVSRAQLETDRSLLDDLNKKIVVEVAKRNDLSEKVSALEKEYNAFKSSSEEKASRNSDLLSEKEKKIRELEETLKKHMAEAAEHDSLIEDLNQQRDELIAMLDKRVHDHNKLQTEVQTSQANLQASILERDSLMKDVENSKKSCQELAAEISIMKSQFSELQGSYERKLEEEQSTSRALSNELNSAKENILKNKEEVKYLCDELKIIQGLRENLEKELLEIYKKAEGSAHDLKEERDLVASLNKEVEVLKKQISEDKEARKNVERDLEEAANALDEMNRNALLLSKEVEMFRSRSESLEAEKKLLYESLHEQKLLSEQAQENAEQTHSILVRFGKEKEQLAKRANKIEEELASMKGEVLRLRRQLSSSGSRVEEGHSSKKSETDMADSASTKKVTKTKKTRTTLEIPQ